MKLFRPKYPAVLKLLYPGRLSKLDTKNALYLTFDDGPVPEATLWVLDVLEEYNAKATFFCIGDNVKKHPDIFIRILREDHAVGNHTYNHLNGWQTSVSAYTNNTRDAEEIMSKIGEKETEGYNPGIKNSELSTPNFQLFRPPYGRIKNSQARALKQEGYKIIMWDVISGDYNSDFSAENCFRNVVDNAESGSIIVFHDSKKAFRNLKIILPQVLEYYSEKGMEFRSLKDAL